MIRKRLSTVFAAGKKQYEQKILYRENLFITLHMIQPEKLKTENGLRLLRVQAYVCLLDSFDLLDQNVAMHNIFIGF